MPSNYDELKRQLGNAQYANRFDPAAINKIPDSVDTTTLRDIGVLAKLGYNDLSEGAKFGAAKNATPGLNNIMNQIQGLAVSATNPAAPSRFDGLMGAIGDRFRANPAVLRQLDADFAEYGRNRPAAEARFMQAVRADPNKMAAAIRTYNGGERRGSAINGQLEDAMNSVLGAPPANLAPPKPPAQPARPVAAAADSPARPARPARPAAPDPDPVRPASRSTQTSQPDSPAADPATVVAGAGRANADSSPAAPAAAPAATGSAAAPATAPAQLELAASDITKNGGVADQIADTALKAFPEDSAQIEAFRTKLKGDPALAERVAQNLNANPDFMNQMMQMANASPEDQSNTTALLRQYGRNDIMDLMRNPDKLADDSFIDHISSKLKQASGGLDMGGFFGQLKDMIAGFIGPEFMNMICGLFERFQQCIGGLGKGGNFISMGNGSNPMQMIGNVIDGFGRSGDFAQWSQNAREVALSSGARAVDRNNDGVISDGFERDASGKIMTHEETKDGKKVTVQNYDAAKDDRVEYVDADGGKHKAFQTTGVDLGSFDGKPVQFAITAVNQNGQPTDGVTIFVRPGSVEFRDPDTGELRPQNRPAAQADAANPNGRAPNMPAPEAPNPNGAMSRPSNDISVNLSGLS